MLKRGYGSNRRAGGDLELERIPSGIAAGLIRAAMDLTDLTWDPDVSEGYAAVWAAALLRAPPRHRLRHGATASRHGAHQSATGSSTSFSPSPEGQGLPRARQHPRCRPWNWPSTSAPTTSTDCRCAGAGRGAVRGPKVEDRRLAVAATREAIPLWRETMGARSDPAAGGRRSSF